MRLSIAGGGRAAWTFGRLAIRAGLTLGPLILRPGSRSPVPDLLGAGRVSWDDRPRCDALLVAVADQALDEVCSIASSTLEAGTVMLHCSGSRDSSLFARAEAGSLHPLASLPSPGVEPDLSDALFVFEGSDQALELSRRLTDAAGAQLATIRPEMKPRYHAGAVFGSNYVAVMLELALELIGDAGADMASRAAIASLARSAVANWEQEGRDGLTGPVVRRDADTIGNHLRALGSRDELRGIYSALAAELLRMSGSHGEGEKIQHIAALLDTRRIR